MDQTTGGRDQTTQLTQRIRLCANIISADSPGFVGETELPSDAAWLTFFLTTSDEMDRVGLPESQPPWLPAALVSSVALAISGSASANGARAAAKVPRRVIFAFGWLTWPTWSAAAPERVARTKTFIMLTETTRGRGCTFWDFHGRIMRTFTTQFTGAISMVGETAKRRYDG